MKHLINSVVTFSLFFISIVMISCSSDNPNENTPEPKKIDAYKIVVNATKNSGINTRGLTLDGSTLNQNWDEGESVTVIKKDGVNWTEIGSLTASASSNANTTLSGTVSAELHVNDELYLLFPRTTWDYTGQNGILYDESSETTIEKKYDYAQAIVLLVLGHFVLSIGLILLNNCK